MPPSMRCRKYRRAVRRGGLAGVAVLWVMLWGATNAGAAETAAKDDVIRAIVGISAIIPEDARTAEHFGVLRSGSGVVIDDDGLVLTIGYLMMEAKSAAVTDALGAFFRKQEMHHYADHHAAGHGHQ